MNFLQRNILSFLSFTIIVALSLLLYGDLPDQLPSQFSMDGEVESTWSKNSMIVLMPGIYLGIIFLSNALISISPRKFSMPNSKRAMDIVVFGIGIMCCFLHFALLMHQGSFEFFVRYFSYGMAMFLIIVGNVIGKIERNFFLGIRLPWTIASEANWRATHRFAGRLMVVMGSVLLISNSLIANLPLTITMTVSPFVIPAVYSFVYFLENEKNEETANGDEVN